MLQRIFVVAAWSSVALLAYATLAHVGFVYSVYDWVAPLLRRPNMQAYVHLEHVFAFVFFGAIFAMAYPRRIIFGCIVVSAIAVVLECLQTLTPDRHGELLDAVEKVAGGLIGILVVGAIGYFRRTMRPARNESPAG